MKNTKTSIPPTQAVMALCGITQDHEGVVQRAGLNSSSAIQVIADLVHKRISSLPEKSDYQVVHAETIGLVEHVFNGQYGDNYIDAMHKMGVNHARNGVPLVVLGGSMLITKDIACSTEPVSSQCHEVQAAIKNAFSMSTILILHSYHEAMRKIELEKFLDISGMTVALYDRLHAAYTGVCFIPSKAR